MTDDTPPDPPPRYELPPQHPAQNPPGEHVPDHDHPDSADTPWDIYELLDTADHMRRHVRGYQFDPVYHRLCARLRTYRSVLENMDDILPSSPALKRLLESVESFVGKSPEKGGKL